MATSVLLNAEALSITRQTSFHTLYSPMAGEDSWKGYFGNWYLGIKDPAEDVKPMRALRLWRNRELGNKNKITQRNIYERAMGPGGKPREKDGYSESFFEGSVEDEFYEPNANSINSVGATNQRIVVLSTDAAQLTPALIPPRQKGRWGCESFIVDEKISRWSAICMYDPETGERVRISMIQEFFVDFSDEILDSAIRFDDMPLLPPRERLSRDILEWFGDKCTTSGTSIGMEIDKESGAFLKVPETFWESNAWPPADMIKNLSDDSIDFIPLPDSMYLIAPRSLPIVTDAESSSEMQLEFGGIMRSGEGKLLRRSVLTFDKKGLLKSSRHDKFNINIA